MGLQGKASELLARLKSMRAATDAGKTVKAGGLTISESVYTPPPKGGKVQPAVATIVVENATHGDRVLRRFTFGATRAENVYGFIDQAADFASSTGLTVQGFTADQLAVMREHAEAILERVASIAERGLKGTGSE